MGKNKKFNNSDNEYELVYSTDPQPAKRCNNCLRALDQCVCGASFQGTIKPATRIEKKGRAGKAVTVVTKLPGNEAFLKRLLKQLKSSLGCGGTYYIQEGQGVIEVQGERSQQVLDLIREFK